MALAAQLLVTAGIAKSAREARQALTLCLDSGHAGERFGKMVSQLGGPQDLLENHDKYLRRAAVIQPVLASRAGFVAAYDTRQVGLVVVALGGGRTRATDAIDVDVGLSGIVSLGTHVNAGDPLATVHARTEASAEAALHALQQAITISDAPPTKFPLIQALN